MSTKKTNKKNKNNNKNIKDYKVVGGLDYKRISVLFVDSVFNQATSNLDSRDPLNSPPNDFYSKKPRTSNLEQLKTPSKSNLSNDKEKSQKKPKTSYKPSSVEKNSTSKLNNSNDSFNQKKLVYNTSVKTIKRKNKYYNRNPKASQKNTNKTKKTYSSITKKYKAKLESEKEKKYYQERVKLLENRIVALKNHQEEMHRKMLNNDVRQTYLEFKKKEKNDMKKTLLSYDIDKRNELDLRRKQIKGQKDNLNKNVKESMEKTRKIKMNVYQTLQKEKQLRLARKNENSQQWEQFGKDNINKIKKEREQAKKDELKKQKYHGKTIENFYMETCEDNINETNKLKNKLQKLEKLEEKYINDLNETRKVMNRNNSEEHYLFKKEAPPIRKLDLENRAFSNKNSHKNTQSMDDLNNYYNINEDDSDNDYDDKNIIRVGKTMK